MYVEMTSLTNRFSDPDKIQARYGLRGSCDGGLEWGVLIRTGNTHPTDTIHLVSTRETCRICKATGTKETH